MPPPHSRSISHPEPDQDVEMALTYRPTPLTPALSPACRLHDDSRVWHAPACSPNPRPTAEQTLALAQPGSERTEFAIWIGLRTRDPFTPFAWEDGSLVTWWPRYTPILYNTAYHLLCLVGEQSCVWFPDTTGGSLVADGFVCKRSGG